MASGLVPRHSASVSDHYTASVVCVKWCECTSITKTSKLQGQYIMNNIMGSAYKLELHKAC